MDFRVKKLILEEGMKNIAETEGVKLEMNFDDYHKTIEVEFKILSDDGFSFDFVRHTCSYGSLERANDNVFVTIEKTRREVYEKKHPTPVGIMIPRHGKSMLLNEMLKSGGINPRYGYFSKTSKIPKIKNVIFNYPATIVFWADGDKTVVKCQGDDIYDPEKGLAMAIIKKMHGGKGNYCEIFKPWIEKYKETYIKEYAATLMKESVEFYKAACETSADDIEDILDGKVDPLMIKVDEAEAPTEKACLMRSCPTCKYGSVSVTEDPCKTCLGAKDVLNGRVLPKWEPKEQKTDKPEIRTKNENCKTCYNWRTSLSRRPCRDCVLNKNWRPKK